MPDSTHRGWTFDDFTIDLDAMRLIRGAETVSVEPQVLDVIVYLVENAGRVVSRDELIETVWRGRIVSDSAVSTRIGAARRALGDDGGTQKYIKTVHGRGFRFEVRPRQLSDSADPSHVALFDHDPCSAFPVRSTPLIGRERHIGLVKRLITEPDARLVTLTGVGGSGKTRLAECVAREVVSAFANGAWFVDLAPLRDTALVASTIAQTLGVQEASDRPLLESLKDYLKVRNLLLVLDNFEHLLPAANVVTDLLHACKELKVLVTSRATLRLTGEHEVPVPPLTLPDLDDDPASRDGRSDAAEAVQLFEDRARAVRPEIALTLATRQAIAEICVRLDGLPLAIELAAARVRLFTPVEILSRMDRCLPLLTGGPSDLPERQQTLRNTIVWSFDLLGEAEQQVFSRLAIFSGGFTGDAVESILGEPGDVETLEIIGLLLEKSLIQRREAGGGSRYFMLETLREFAWEKLLLCADLDALRRKHAAYFLAFAEAIDGELRGPLQTERLAQLAREHDNLRAALTWTLTDRADVEMGARIVDGLWWFWGVRGHFSEGRQWTNQAEAVVEDLSPRTRAGILRAQANFAFLQGDYAMACKWADEACALLKQLGATGAAAFVQGTLAISLQYQGETKRARGLLEGGLDTARALEDEWLVAWMLRNLGRIAHDREEDEPASRYLEESLALTRRIGDTRGVALSLHYLGVLALGSNPQQALSYLDESIGLFRRIDDRRGLGWALHYLAAAALDLGDATGARQAETESLSLRVELGDKRGIAECLEGHASLLSAAGRADAAIRLFAAAAKLRESISAPGPPADRQRTQRHLLAAEANVDATVASEAWREGASTPAKVVIKELTGAAR